MKPKFKCKSNAQKYAIRAYYAKKNKAGKPSKDCEEQRERYMKVMREDFPKDFISDAIKRILAVLLLIALGLGVGYLCYTCSRLPSDAEIAEVYYEQTL